MLRFLIILGISLSSQTMEGSFVSVLKTTEQKFENHYQWVCIVKKRIFEMMSFFFISETSLSLTIIGGINGIWFPL